MSLFTKKLPPPPDVTELRGVRDPVGTPKKSRKRKAKKHVEEREEVEQTQGLVDDVAMLMHDEPRIMAKFFNLKSLTLFAFTIFGAYKLGKRSATNEIAQKLHGMRVQQQRQLAAQAQAAQAQQQPQDGEAQVEQQPEEGEPQQTYAEQPTREQMHGASDDQSTQQGYAQPPINRFLQ